MLAAGGIGGFVATRSPNAALAPWEQAGNYDDIRLFALSYAILAPNPHNRQPWVAELTGDTGLVIWRDPSRNLPETDPFDRQLTIGMGCFLELLQIAAAERGHTLSTQLYPEGETGPVARVAFGGGGQPDPHFSAVLQRHTNRRAYADTALGNAEVSALSPYGTVITDTAQVDEIRALAWQAMETEMLTHRTHMESINLMRMGKSEINANPDGIALGGPLLETMMLAGQLNREGLADPASAMFRQSLDFLKSDMAATPAYAAITTPANTRADQIRAGRLWLRMHLAATQIGLSMQPVSQALQEYPEQAAHYAKVHELLAGPGETVQMLGRLGYGPKAAPSPRWPMETRMNNA